MTQTLPTSSITEMAEEIFGLTVLAWRQRLMARHAADAPELSESQFLTLDTLVKHSTLTVGEIQRSINVLPAQMSRIIRSLETGFDKPLIRCALNQSDKRKIDVTLTPTGRKNYDDFRQSRLRTTIDTLSGLPEHDRQEFVRICRQIKKLYQSSAAPTPAE